MRNMRIFWLWYAGLFFVYSTTVCIIAATQHNTGAAWVDGICAIVDAVCFVYWWGY